MVNPDRTSCRGVVGILMDTEGRVVHTECDFDESVYGGFSQTQAQKMRVKNRILTNGLRNYMSDYIHSKLSKSTLQYMTNDLLNSGFKIHYEFIGEPNEQE